MDFGCWSTNELRVSLLRLRMLEYLRGPSKSIEPARSLTGTHNQHSTSPRNEEGSSRRKPWKLRYLNYVIWCLNSQVTGMEVIPQLARPSNPVAGGWICKWFSPSYKVSGMHINVFTSRKFGGRSGTSNN